jgi:hypothetical protein
MSNTEIVEKLQTAIANNDYEELRNNLSLTEKCRLLAEINSNYVSKLKTEQIFEISQKILTVEDGISIIKNSQNYDDISKAFALISLPEDLKERYLLKANSTPIIDSDIDNKVFEILMDEFQLAILATSSTNDQIKLAVTSHIQEEAYKTMILTTLSSDELKLSSLKEFNITSEENKRDIIDSLISDEIKIANLGQFKNNNKCTIICNLNSDTLKLQNLTGLEEGDQARIIASLSSDELKLENINRVSKKFELFILDSLTSDATKLAKLDKTEIKTIVRSASDFGNFEIDEEIEKNEEAAIKKNKRNVDILCSLKSDALKAANLDQVTDNSSKLKIINSMSKDENRLISFYQVFANNSYMDGDMESLLSKLTSAKLKLENLYKIEDKSRRNNVLKTITDVESIKDMLPLLEPKDHLLLLIKLKIEEQDEKEIFALMQKMNNHEDLSLILNEMPLSQSLKLINNYRENEIFNYLLNADNYKNLPSRTQLLDIALLMNKQNFDSEAELTYKLTTAGIDIKQALESTNKIIPFFAKTNLNINDFMQYGENTTKYNWERNIYKICSNNDNMEQFIKVYEYFKNSYYDATNNTVTNIKNFLETQAIYSKYKDLCVSLANSNIVLSNKDKDNLNWLLINQISNTPIRKISDIDLAKEKQRLEFVQDTKSTDKEKIKDDICLLLFNKTSKDVQDTLANNGNVERLKILEFNNKNNTDIVKRCEQLMIFASMMDDVTNNLSLEQLQSVLERCLSNKEQINEFSSLTSKVDDMYRRLYEQESIANLTNITNLIATKSSLTSTTKAQKLSTKYGGAVLDLSDSQYTLLAHVKSYSETTEELINGQSTGNSNFISLSPISHRGQVYYYGNQACIFAYENIPDGNFICSSPVNMSSNGAIEKNSLEVNEINRHQLGILESSEARSGSNAETLLFREQLKPSGIILPGGREPTAEELAIHNKYNLPFIITQEYKATIKDPQPIKNVTQQEKLEASREKDIAELKELKEKLLTKTMKPDEPRKIAIITDSHGMYEPTLACLEDARRSGITEMYSLGDNIGLGPNPSEVMDLLDAYHVKSVIGNHELYASDEKSIAELGNHFTSYSKKEAEDNSRWTRAHLTAEEIEEIQKMPEKIEIVSKTGQKITLVHSAEPYSTTGKYSKAPDIDPQSQATIEGHKHFASALHNGIITARAVGIGQESGQDGVAQYLTLTEQKDGSFKTEIHNVNYDMKNLLQKTNESDLPSETKDKLVSWVNPEKGGKNK